MQPRLPLRTVMIDSANNWMDHQFSLANITQVDGVSRA